ncbi:MAG TPA: alpha/beta hydrolase [Thermoleophilaceae bacterium]
MTAAAIRDIDVTVKGNRSPGIEAGPENADEAVVFVHGNPGESRDWADLVGRVGEHGRAVALDFPAFGRADRPSGDFEYSSFGYAAHLGGALHELGIARVHLVMHDFGGPWGLVWASGAPEALRSAVLVNTGFLKGYRWHPMARRWRTPVLGELIQLATTRRLWHRFVEPKEGRPLPDAFVDRLYDNLDWGQKRAVLKLYRATDRPDQLLDLLGEQFRELDRPALVVWGRHDPFLPIEQARHNLEGFPSARIEILEDSGHFPFADDPERTAAIVVPFLRDQLGR